MERKKPVTMRDVAAHAGVSPATVSRALSGNRFVDEGIQQKVHESAAILGYRVNLLGRALRQQRLNAVGLLIPDLENPFFAALAEQLGRFLRDHRYEILVTSTQGSFEIEDRAIDSFLGQQIHSLIVIACDENESAKALERAQKEVPVVQYDRRVSGVNVPFVGCNNAEGIELIAQYIGSTNYADDPLFFVGASTTSSSGRERRDTFQNIFPQAHFLDGNFTVDWGHTAAYKILGLGVRKATIVAAADIVAIGIIAALQQAGYQIPEDFRVIGFDGIGVTGFALPLLTTVRQPVELMNEAVLRLIETDTADSKSQEELLTPTFILGDSSS